MYKQLYVTHENKPCEVIIRNYTEDDFLALIEVQKECFPPPFPEELWWSIEQLNSHITRFPEGALCATVNSKIVGSMTGLTILSSDYEAEHSWSNVTDDGYIRNHNRHGDTLYVVDIAVVPTFRKAGIGKWLMQSMYETVVQLQLKRLAGGGRMPGYHKLAQTCSPEQYLEGIMQGRINDPVINFLLRCGRVPTQLLPHYLEDEESMHFAILMEWHNPFITD